MKKGMILFMVSILVACTPNIKEETTTPKEEMTTTMTTTIQATGETTTTQEIIETTKAMQSEKDIDDYNSIYVIINKQRPLPENYEPSDLVIPNVSLMKELYLRKEAAKAIEEMFEAALNDGIELKIGSGYRSYAYQSRLYSNYAKRDGEEAASRYSSKPGQSEHQTGLVVDLAASNEVCYLEQCFEDTKEAQWLFEHSYKYGFVLRYLKDKEDITGYMYEPWHYRYIGKEEAKKVYESGLTLEEYFGLVE